jgi:small subunit ribosomal protein S1
MSEQVQSQEEFLANFNWHNFEEGIDPVNQENLKEFEELVTKTFISTDQEEVVDGTVVRIQIETLSLISTRNRKV